MARTFASASTDRIDLSVGTLTNSDGSVFAALVRRADASNYHGIFSIVNGSTQAVYSVEFDNTANGLYVTDPSGDWNISMSGATPGTTWLLVVVTQQGGSGAYDADVLDTSTGAWTNALSSSATPSGTPASARIGSWCASAGGGGGFNDYFNGQIAWLAYWGTVPSRFTSSTSRQHFFQGATLAQIAAYNPDAMWVLDQGAVADSVRDLTGNGANQSSVSGTTVSTVAAPTTSYGDAPLSVAVTAPAGGSATVVAVAAAADSAALVPTVTAIRTVAITGVTAAADSAVPTHVVTAQRVVAVASVAATTDAVAAAPTVTAVGIVSVAGVAATADAEVLAPTISTGVTVNIAAVAATADAAVATHTVTTVRNAAVTAVPATADAAVPASVVLSGQRIEPAGTTAAGNWTAEPTGALHGVTSDASDSTWAELDDGSDPSTMILTLDTLLNPSAGDATLTVRARMIT